MTNLNLYPWREVLEKRHRHFFIITMLLTILILSLSAYLLDGYFQNELSKAEKVIADLESNKQETTFENTFVPSAEITFIQRAFNKLAQLHFANICFDALEIQNTHLQVTGNTFSLQRVLAYIKAWRGWHVQLFKLQQQHHQLIFKLRMSDHEL